MNEQTVARPDRLLLPPRFAELLRARAARTGRTPELEAAQILARVLVPSKRLRKRLAKLDATELAGGYLQ